MVRYAGIFVGGPAQEGKRQAGMCTGEGIKETEKPLTDVRMVGRNTGWKARLKLGKKKVIAQEKGTSPGEREDARYWEWEGSKRKQPLP